MSVLAAAALLALPAHAAVDNSTVLKDGSYTPTTFNWSGGSGRLAYIKCHKVTVQDGRAQAEIEFSSTHYDRVRVDGTEYKKESKGKSTFKVPVAFNTNMAIDGRTTAMSQPHWVSYKIYVGLNESGSVSEKALTKQTQKAKQKLLKKGPVITGLTYQSREKTGKAQYFRLFHYDHDVALIQINIGKDTAMAKRYAKNAKKAAKTAGKVQYDDEGQPIAKSQEQIISALYKNTVVNYLVVPQDYDVPAGLERDYVIVRKPVTKSAVYAKPVQKTLSDLGKADAVTLKGAWKKIDYSDIVQNQIGLVVLPDSALKNKGKMETTEKRFATLNIPVLIDRTKSEKSKSAKANWQRVYKTIYGENQ